MNQNNLISNDPLFSLKETFICTFCGGKNCKHENYKNHQNPAIIGLNSDQIDDNIYASQRPANSLIKEFNLISKFKELNIGLIVNLQLPGEHPYCGPIEKLDESGFSYSPSLFESEGIHVGLYGWKDMNVPNSLNHMLSIVKSMYYYIHNLKKKILVHCHAGYGRTGIVIACFKIFDESISAEVAKAEIRKIRPKCIQNKDQFLYCSNFQEYIKRLKGNFYLKEKRTIENFLKYQNDLNVGNYTFINFTYNKSIPLFLLYLFDSLIDIKIKNNLDDFSLYKYLNRSLTMNERGKELSYSIGKNINEYNWDVLYSCEDPMILCELLYQWLQNSIQYVIDPKNISEINTDFSDYDKKLKTCEQQTILLICKFLILIKDNLENEEITLEKKNFLKILSKNLLGYCTEETELKEEESQNVEKLIKLFDFIIEKKNKEEEDLKDKEDDKEHILFNAYKQLKLYFENKKVYVDNSKLDLVNQINPETLYKSINTIFNNKNTKNTTIQINKNNSDNKNYLESIEESYNLQKNTNLKNQNNRTGKSYIQNINNNTIKLSKSFRSNMISKESKNQMLTSFKIEEEKDIPWMREEDC